MEKVNVALEDLWASLQPHLQHLPLSLRPTSPQQLAAAAAVVVLTLLALGLLSSKPSGKPAPKASGDSKLTNGVDAAKVMPQLPTPEQAMQLMVRRRAIFPKDYTGKPIPHATIEAMLEAANWAPTHGKTEPWRFVVFESPEARQQLYDLTLEVVKEELQGEALEARVAKINGNLEKKWPQVSAMIALCVKRAANPDKIMPEWEEAAATSAAVQNLWLMAAAHGVGGYWSSWYPEVRDSVKFKEFLWLEPEDKCIGMFLVGDAAPDVVAGYRGKRGPLADKVSWRN